MEVRSRGGENETGTKGEGEEKENGSSRRVKTKELVRSVERSRQKGS